MDQNVDSLQEPVNVLGITQIAVRQVLFGMKRLQRMAIGGAEVDALSEQPSAQEFAELSIRARQCNLGHLWSAPARLAAPKNRANRSHLPLGISLASSESPGIFRGSFRHCVAVC
jgi:hypothetical protein